jgi:hypothetical protein
MILLIFFSIKSWIHAGKAQLVENWRAGDVLSAGALTSQIFDGFCLGVLGLTGFEC